MPYDHDDRYCPFTHTMKPVLTEYRIYSRIAIDKGNAIKVCENHVAEGIKTILALDKAEDCMVTRIW